MNRQEEVEALLRAFSGRDLAAIRALAEDDVDLDAPGGLGLTALMRAVLRGHAVTVEWMLAAGANPNAPSDDGLTAYALARELKRSDLMDLLVAAGAQQEESYVVSQPSPAESLSVGSPAALADELDVLPADALADESSARLAGELARGMKFGDQLIDRIDDQRPDDFEDQTADWL